MFNHLIIDTIHLDYQNILMLNFVRSPMTSILYCRNTYSVTFRHPVLSFNLKIIQKITNKRLRRSAHRRSSAHFKYLMIPGLVLSSY